jgi:hypothetical protein
MVDADDGETVREHSASHEIVERRHDEALGQIAAGAEDRHDGGRGPLVGKTLGDRCSVRGKCWAGPAVLARRRARAAAAKR